MQEGCQGFKEPNLSTLLYKSKNLRKEDLKYEANVMLFNYQANSRATLIKI